MRQQTDFAKYRQIKLEGENQIKDTLYPKYFADNTTNLEKIELPSKEEYDFILNILLGLEKGVDKKVKIAHSSCEIGLDDGNIAGGKNKSLIMFPPGGSAPAALAAAPAARPTAAPAVLRGDYSCWLTY